MSLFDPPPVKLSATEEETVADILKSLRNVAHLLPEYICDATLALQLDYSCQYLNLWSQNCNLQVRCICLQRDGKHFQEVVQKLVSDTVDHHQKLYNVRTEAKKGQGSTD